MDGESPQPAIAITQFGKARVPIGTAF